MSAARSNDYVIRLKTQKNLGTESFARGLLSGWCHQLPQELRPEHFDVGEPVRRSLESEGLDAAVKTWVENKRPLYLARRTKPRMMAATNWRPEKGQDPRPFPWGTTVWLARSAGDDLAVAMFRFLIHHLEPAFGMISTEEESRAKHFVTWQDRLGKAEKYMGLDVGRFASVTTEYGREIVPGVYWITYFGAGATNIIGERKLDQLKANKVERIENGFLVFAYPSVNAVGTTAGRQAEDDILDQLGRQHFFDKDELDVQMLRTDEVTAARVERQVERITSARKR